MACESASKTDMVMIFGEITTSAKVDYEKVVRDTCREIGFTSKDVGLDADTCQARACHVCVLLLLLSLCADSPGGAVCQHRAVVYCRLAASRMRCCAGLHLQAAS